MATLFLQADSAQATPSLPSIYDLASEVQELARRAQSLSSAIDFALEHSGDNFACHGRILDFLALQNECLTKAADLGEEIERQAKLLDSGQAN